MNEDHTLVRATLVPAVVLFLAAHYGISEDAALERFYSSKTARAFAEDATGLYGVSALNIAGLCISEDLEAKQHPQSKVKGKGE